MTKNEAAYPFLGPDTTIIGRFGNLHESLHNLGLKIVFDGLGSLCLNWPYTKTSLLNYFPGESRMFENTG